VAWEVPVDAVAAVAVDVSASAPAGRALSSCGASPRRVAKPLAPGPELVVEHRQLAVQELRDLLHKD